MAVATAAYRHEVLFYQRIAAQVGTRTPCFYADGTVPVAVVDWQSVAAAPGVIDVSYFLGNSMKVADRLAGERDLVIDYHDALTGRGVENYPFEQCWREYRAHALFGLILTIPVSMSVQTT
jgi:hypothetical protein